MDTPPEAKGDWKLWGRRPADLLLFGVTAAELAILIWLADSLRPTTWIYLCSNLLVLAIALTRRPAQEQDRSIAAAIAVLISYTYSYGQEVLLHYRPGYDTPPAASAAGFILVLIGASWSLVSLLSLGRFFGVRPALRGLSTRGTYRLVRHPLYLAYLIQDIGYNLSGWSPGTLALVALGWASLIYRIHAEERILSHHPDWPTFSSRTPSRLLPGIW